VRGGINGVMAAAKAAYSQWRYASSGENKWRSVSGRNGNSNQLINRSSISAKS